MGFFSFFSKEKKETLDKGLSKTKESVFSKIARAVAGKSKVDDEVLDNLEEVLITSDVGVETTLNIIKRIEERVARDKYVNTKELNTILREEIAALLTENNTMDSEEFSVPDLDALNWADTCLLVLPCGRSAHTEAGWMKGAGKRTIVYIPEMQEAELMYKLFDLVSGNLEEINAFLNNL